MTTRARLVTHQDPLVMSVASQLPRPLFDRLEAHCKRTGTLKAQFIRDAIEERLDQFRERGDG